MRPWDIAAADTGRPAASVSLVLPIAIFLRLATRAATAMSHDVTAQSVLANIRALERAVELGGSIETLERHPSSTATAVSAGR